MQCCKIMHFSNFFIKRNPMARFQMYIVSFILNVEMLTSCKIAPQKAKVLCLDLFC